MEYIEIVIILVAISVGIIFYVKFNRKDRNLDILSEDTTTSLTNANVLPDEIHKFNELGIQIEMISIKDVEDRSKLVEIKDSKILAQINNLISDLAQASNDVNNMLQIGRGSNEGVVYKAIIPAGTKLANSKAMKGAVRGFYSGANGIEGHANFVAVEAENGPIVVANSISAAMSVTSMIVGQYYLTHINTELSVISDEISQIQDFQSNEYQSRVLSLIAHVKRITDFQTEILENEELRLSKIAQLDSLEEECTQLLGQANLTLVGLLKRKVKSYEEYEKVLGDAQNWFIYQKSLLDILGNISDLRYTLHLGKVTRNQCTTLLSTYTKQVSDMQECLSAWHNEMIRKFGIEIEEKRRRRDGFDGMIHSVFGMFKDDLKFRPIEKKTAAMIAEQASGHLAMSARNTSELYSKDVQIISQNGKLYYLPGTEAE